ncbi:MAG: hypothetical protein AB7O56_09750 [Bauldia sp.]
MPDTNAFQAALEQPEPPPAWSPPLVALWHAAKGNWDTAHEIVQAEEGDPDAAWVHAHLHRIEGDLDNARYWYGQARRPYTSVPLDEERVAIAVALLAT